MSETKSKTAENNDHNSLHSNGSIEKLFDLKRIKSSKLSLLLYSPIGLCLFVIRFFIFLYILLISTILPYNSSLRSIVFRSLFVILGISLNYDENFFRKLNAKYFIVNHISDLDPILINIVLPACISLMNANNQPCYIKWLCQNKILKSNNDNTNEYDNNDDSPVLNKNKQIVYFPEQTKTNGRFGLLKFFQLNNQLNYYYDYSSRIHMLFIETKRPFFNVSLSTINSTWLTDLFWILFLPITIFDLRHLGTIEKTENETNDEFLKRLQAEMASKTGTMATDYRLMDKREYLKRLMIEKRQNNKRKSSMKTSANSKTTSKQQMNKTNQQSSKIDDYSKKVKEILPQVPVSVIREDILITNDIDDTVERILTGVVKFIPEKLDSEKIKCKNIENNGVKSNISQQQQQQSNPGSSSSSNIENNRSSIDNDNNKQKLLIIENKNFGAKTFGKTSAERMASFQERKEQMYRMARISYLKKRGLLNNDLFVE